MQIFWCGLQNFADELKDVLGVVRRLLEGVRVGAKAKHVAIICKVQLHLVHVYETLL